MTLAIAALMTMAMNLGTGHTLLSICTKKVSTLSTISTRGNRRPSPFFPQASIA
jgi:hypothetical protein